MTNDLQGTAEFYSTVLGLPLLKYDKNALIIDAGSSQLLFRSSENLHPVHHFAFNIPCNQIDAALHYLRQKDLGVFVYEGHQIIDFSAWNAKAIYFEDNNGNILELIARFDLNNKSMAPFGPGSFLCLSEIAIVANDVEAQCRDLENTIGLLHYDKQPAHQNFAAMGNAEGLLIISSEGRNWFPTEIPAQKSPVTITLLQNNRQYSLDFNHDLAT